MGAGKYGGEGMTANIKGRVKLLEKQRRQHLAHKKWYKLHKNTPEYKAKMRAYQQTPEYKAKMRAYYKNIKNTPEYKAKNGQFPCDNCGEYSHLRKAQVDGRRVMLCTPCLKS